jgi:hypothetical protein
MSSRSPVPTSAQDVAEPEPSLDHDGEQEVEGEDVAEPLTMAASAVLIKLPQDAREALETVAKDGGGEKGT